MDNKNVDEMRKRWPREQDQGQRSLKLTYNRQVKTKGQVLKLMHQ